MNNKFVMSGKKEILNTDPFSPEFMRVKEGKNYLTVNFQKNLILPARQEKLIELKDVHHFKLCLVYPIIEAYINFLSEKRAYKSDVSYIRNILGGRKNKEVIDITKQIPRLLPYMADKGYLSVYDLENSKYLPQISYHGVGSYAPFAGRGDIIYEIDGLELFRTIHWIS